VLPEWWGAQGDGAADDTWAVHKAVDSQGRVRLGPRKNYRITEGICLYSGQALSGGGVTSKITLDHRSGGTHGAIVSIAGARAGWGAEYKTGGSASCQGNEISGVHLVGKGVPNENGIGITHAHHTITDNCFFTNCGQKAWTVQYAATGNIFQNSVIHSAAVSPQADISIEGLAGKEVQGTTIANINIFNSQNTALLIDYADNNQINNIVVDNPKGRVLFINNGSKYNQAGNLHIYRPAGNGALCQISHKGTQFNIVENVVIQGTAAGPMVALTASASHNKVTKISGAGSSTILEDYSAGNNEINEIIGTTSHNYGMYIDASSLHNTISNCRIGVADGGYAYAINSIGNILTANKITQLGAAHIAAGQKSLTGNSWQP
jgi:hypothetical protein